MTNIKIEHGFVITAGDGNYYGSNGLGDWTVCETESNAEIFTEESEAREVIDRQELLGFQVREVCRLVAFYNHPLNEKQLNKIRKFIE